MISTIERLRQRGISEWADASAFTEARMKIHTAGYGSAPIKADVPEGDLTAILEGAREVNTTLKIQISGYGRRNVSVRVLPARASSEGPRDVRLRVPGYGYAPTTMSFARA